MSALVLEWQRVDAVRVGWVPQPQGPAIPAAIVGPPGASGSGGAAVTSVNTRTGAVVLDKSDVALGNVDNTADASKPVSAAVATALDARQPLAAVLSDTTASFTTAKDAKLTGIATGATANDSDANLRARANHTGTLPASTIGDFTEAAQDIVGAMIAATGGTYDDAAGTITLPPGGGGGDPLSLANGTGAAPMPGTIKFGRATLAGQDLPTFRTAHNGSERLLQADVVRTRLIGMSPQPGNTTLVGAMVLPGGAVLGTATARGIGAANRATRQVRVGYLSAAAAGSLSGYYHNSASSKICTLGDGAGIGGFRFCGRFVPADPATVAGARMYFGLAGTQAAPTNVEPSALTDVVGIAQLSTSTTLHVVYGGSAAQVPIDLGANFPADTPTTDIYELLLFSDPTDNSRIGYRVERINTGHVASGSMTNTTPGTTLPASTTLLGLRAWRTNNATALAVALDIAIMSVTVEA